jgi:hypothetical protein
MSYPLQASRAAFHFLPVGFYREEQASWDRGVSDMSPFPSACAGLGGSEARIVLLDNCSPVWGPAFQRN